MKENSLTLLLIQTELLVPKAKLCLVQRKLQPCVENNTLDTGKVQQLIWTGAARV